MLLKGKFKNKPYFFKIILLVALIFSSALIFTSFSYACIMMIFNISFSEINSFLDNMSNPHVINSLKVLQGVTTISLFIIPVVIFSYLCEINLQLNKIPNRYAILIGVAIIVVINPIIDYLYQINQIIELPNWMYLYEMKAAVLTEAFLQMNHISDVFINIIVIAFIASVAEEFFFRGILQQILIQSSNQINASILITAFLFSAVHMQFQGFFPRFALGLLLGYIFYWSKNLWVPIIMHFMNNAIIILLSYYPIQKFTGINILDFNTKINYEEVFFSALAVFILVFLFKKRAKTIQG